MTLPLTVCSLDEARAHVTNDGARAVVSIVDTPAALGFEHPNHLVRACSDSLFGDYNGFRIPGTPGPEDVKAIVDFAAAIGPDPGVVVHCQLGTSRSPAGALAMLLAWGWPPADAANELSQAHPDGRPFRPNPALVRYTDQAFDLDGALCYAVIPLIRTSAASQCCPGRSTCSIGSSSRAQALDRARS